MARTYGYALVGALLATFTVTPCLSSLLLPAHVSEVETFVVRLLRSVYAPVLRWSLTNRKITVALGLVFLVVSGFLGSELGSEFLPTLEEGKSVDSRLVCRRPSRSKPACLTSRRIREILLRHPEIVTVVSQHGRPDNGSDAAGFFNAEFFAPLKPFDEWPSGMTKDKLIEQLQAEFANEFTGIGFNFSQYIQDNVEEGLSGVKGANSVKIIGPDLATLERLAGRVLSRARQGSGNCRSGRVSGFGTAEPEHHGRSVEGGALRAERHRYQLRGSGRVGRHRRDDGVGSRSSIRSCGTACAGISLPTRRDWQDQDWGCDQ